MEISLVAFYTARINTHDVPTLLKFLAGVEVYAYSLEKSKRGKKHAHLYWASNKQLQTFRYRANALGFHKNPQYSSKQIFPLQEDNDDEFPVRPLAYLSKDGIYKHHNIPPDVITAAEKMRKVFKKLKAMTYIQKLEEYILANNNNIIPDRTMLLQKIVEYHIEKKIPPRDHQITFAYHHILLQTFDSYKKIYIQLLLNKIER